MVDTYAQASSWFWLAVIQLKLDFSILKVLQYSPKHGSLAALSRRKYLLLMFCHAIFLPVSLSKRTKRPAYGTNSSPGSFRRSNPR